MRSCPDTTWPDYFKRLGGRFQPTGECLFLVLNVTCRNAAIR